MLRIEYRCPCCGTEWEEEWPCACDSTCPGCEVGDIEAFNWEHIEGTPEGDEDED